MFFFFKQKTAYEMRISDWSSDVCSSDLSRTFRTDVHPCTQIPAKNASGRSSASANHAGGREPSGCGSGSLNDVHGTTQRLSGPSQRRQCGDLTLRTLVTPGSVFRP